MRRSAAVAISSAGSRLKVWSGEEDRLEPAAEGQGLHPAVVDDDVEAQRGGPLTAAVQHVGGRVHALDVEPAWRRARSGSPSPQPNSCAGWPCSSMNWA